MLGWRSKEGKRRADAGFLQRLRKDIRGNTIALMAAAILPMIGLMGGALDMSRTYLAKTRLQQACDAGALAGRKVMGAGQWAANNYAARAAADQFFAGNFKDGAWGTTGLSHSYSENGGKVTGTASVTVPMTLMKVFSAADKQLTVSCDAEMRLPNTDIMFVLDTTGSMSSPQPGDSVDKITALKTAVKCFYEIVAKLDTDATCSTGTPSGGTGNQVQIRFGFVPYSVNVNVGRLLNTGWIADNWTYQTRVGRWWVLQSTSAPQTTSVSQSGVYSNQCTDAYAESAGYNNPTITYSPSGSTPYATGTKKTVVEVQTHVTGWSNYTCYGTQTRTTKVYKLLEGVTPTANDVWEDWHYGALSQNVSGLKNGSSWNSSFTAYLNNSGAPKTINWDGCIEERPTVRQSSYWPIPSGAKDLDIDTVPSGTSNQWGPALPGMIYTRNGGGPNWGWNLAEPLPTTTDYGNQSSYTCPVPAKKMQVWSDPNAFSSYVNSLSPGGNTYHDVGLTWGARLISPTGLFASENATTPQGGQIDRHIIFMTDGDACTSVSNYESHGVAWFDRRTTDPSVVPTEGCTSTGTLTTQVNVRTEAMCEAIKAKNITLWVVAFGDLASSTVTRLQNCASNGKYFTATNAAQLQATFKSIADQISQLRLTR